MAAHPPGSAFEEGGFNLVLSKLSAAAMDEKLLTLATEFREAIVRSKRGFPDLLKNKFSSFPKQTCEYTSNLLGRFLAENGFADVQYVWGVRWPDAWPKDESHAWLEICDVIVDITADQFPDGPAPVIVTRSHLWHSQFSSPQRPPERRPVTNLQTYSRRSEEDYDLLYDRIVKCVVGC
jgi:hypothetical protein